MLTLLYQEQSSIVYAKLIQIHEMVLKHMYLAIIKTKHGPRPVRAHFLKFLLFFGSETGIVGFDINRTLTIMSMSN